MLAVAAAAAILTLTPRMGLAPLRLEASIRIRQKTEEMYCPSIKIEWGPGITSYQESDCPPWEELTEEEKGEIYVYSRRSPGSYGCGIDGGCEYEIRVTLKQGRKTIVLTDTIIVH